MSIFLWEEFSPRGGEEEHDSNGGDDIFTLPLALNAIYFLSLPSLTPYYLFLLLILLTEYIVVLTGGILVGEEEAPIRSFEKLP